MKHRILFIFCIIFNGCNAMELHQKKLTEQQNHQIAKILADHKRDMHNHRMYVASSMLALGAGIRYFHKASSGQKSLLLGLPLAQGILCFWDHFFSSNEDALEKMGKICSTNSLREFNDSHGTFMNSVADIPNNSMITYFRPFIFKSLVLALLSGGCSYLSSDMDTVAKDMFSTLAFHPLVLGFNIAGPNIVRLVGDFYVHKRLQKSAHKGGYLAPVIQKSPLSTPIQNETDPYCFLCDRKMDKTSVSKILLAQCLATFRNRQQSKLPLIKSLGVPALLSCCTYSVALRYTNNNQSAALNISLVAGSLLAAVYRIKNVHNMQ